jgi:hypothetical protein
MPPATRQYDRPLGLPPAPHSGSIVVNPVTGQAWKRDPENTGAVPGGWWRTWCIAGNHPTDSVGHRWASVLIDGPVVVAEDAHCGHDRR